MGIESSSDLILDVVRAADPTRASAVAARLNALAANAAPSEAGFSAALEEAGAATVQGASSWRPEPRAESVVSRAAEGTVENDKTATKFEAMVLSSLIGEMMPKEASSVYGGGLAGDMWRSMLAEKVADQVAKSGALGIARHLFDGGHGAAAEALTRASRSNNQVHGEVTLMSRNDLSLPAGADVANGAVLFAGGKAL